MALTPKESLAVNDMAELFYNFLPGSGSRQWAGHVSFQSVAQKVGIGPYWQPGSKTPMLVSLFTRTLEDQRHRFEPLILEIVRAGITYCQRNGHPLQPSHIDRLNGILLQLGFRFPDLWDPGFKESLRIDGAVRAKQHVEQALKAEHLKANAHHERLQQLRQLKEQFTTLHGMASRQTAGIELEKVLNRLFALHGLASREPFRVIGEQIDGSFELDHETYLVEAKWEKKPIAENELLVFRGKIEGKSSFTRGVFISLSGITEHAKKAIAHGKQATFFVTDGYDLMMALQDQIDLIVFLRQRRRLLAEEGLISVPFQEIWAGSRGQQRPA
jgi:hypothetical protein